MYEYIHIHIHIVFRCFQCCFPDLETGLNPSALASKKVTESNRMQQPSFVGRISTMEYIYILYND